MNYLIVVLILGLGAGAYYLHAQHVAQVAALQQQELQQEQELAARNAAAAQAAQAAEARSTVTTADGRVYAHCTVLKQDQNGVTFTSDSGIFQIPYWNMTPAEQTEFGYNLHQAAAAAEAQARYDDQQRAAQAANSAGNP